MIKEKLDILYSSGIIQKEVQEYCLDVMKRLNKDGFEVEEEYDMLITHLAMAAERVRKQEEVGTLSDEIWKQVKENLMYAKAKTFCEVICTMAPYAIPQSEVRYLIMHICTLLEKQEEKK